MSAEQPIASTSTSTIDPTPPKSRLGLCSLCAQAARYKCPACAFPSCSLAHSTAHKALTDPPCTGKAKPQYALDIKANELTWGALMRDQSYLSGLSRSVEGVGKQLVQDKLLPTAHAGESAGSGERLDGRSEKEERLVREVMRDGCRLVLLPKGMSKRQKNATRFDHKECVVHWSIEFIVHPTPFSAPHSAPPTATTFLLSPQPSSTHIHSLLTLAFETRDRKLASALNKLPTSERPAPPEDEEQRKAVEQKWLKGFKPSPTAGEDTQMTDEEQEDEDGDGEGDEPPFVLLMQVYAPAGGSPPAPGKPCHILPLSPSSTCTIKSLLEGSSILEYPTLELWPLEKLIAARKGNQIHIVDRKSAAALREEIEQERVGQWTRGRGGMRGGRGSTRGGRGGARGGFAGGTEEFGGGDGRTQDSGWGKRAGAATAEGEPDAKRIRMELDEEGNVESTLGNEAAGGEEEAEDDSSDVSSDDSEDDQRVGAALLSGLVQYDSD